MTTPPPSLPSPTPSSGSSQTKPQSFSSIVALQPGASSTGATSPSGTNNSLGNSGEGSAQADTASDSPHDETQQTPLAGPSHNYGQNAPFLPQVTASPPLHAPQYVPPAQHAMAPDPIHSLSLAGQPGGSVWSPGWRPGPGGPGPSYPQGYGRGGSANGHLTHQLPPNPMEAYGSGSRQSMTSTPGAGQLNGSSSSHGGRSTSQPGEPRDRRRDRHREEESRERDDEEVISTIFVVGFPDDMSEREFQNIFAFAQGFEAATLKFPSGSRREPQAAALLSELQHLAANQANIPGGSVSMMNAEHPDQTLEDSFGGLNLQTQSSSASNTPSAAISLTPSAPTGPQLGSAIPPSVPPRRQTIGFARFKTRNDAIAARDHLQGRRIDPLTGATLKAEMAKKNLHTKRGQTNDDLVGMLLRSGRLSQLVTQQAQAQALNPAGVTSGSATGPGSNLAPPGQLPGQSAKEAWDAWPSPAQANSDGKMEKLQPPNLSSQGGGSSQSTASGSPPMSVKSPNTRQTDSKALLALAEETDDMEPWSVGAVGMNSVGLDYHSGAGNAGAPRSVLGPLSPGNLNGPGVHSPQHPGLGGFGGFGQHGGGNFGSNVGYHEGGIDPRSLGIGANMNPADQNPPINTLYIGNLPAISPPTHPPNFLEESLRALFQRRPGFKRMSFRQKINGPMCFVEFEDIPYATQAMRELYGNTLSGLVKGGIRLSYSKNSLGQRGNSHQQAMNQSMFGGIAHTVALAGMSSGPSGNQMGPNPGGYAMAASQPVPIGPPNAQGGPSNNDRRPSEAPSSLSPTAQPFNAPLPTSPRSQRYYAPGEQRPPISSTPSSSNVPGSSAIPSKGDASNAFSSFAPSSAGQGGFSSPVSSPIRTPASLGWVSSGANSNNANSTSANTYGAFDAFAIPPHGLGSLNGAANAWNQNPNNTSA